MTPIEQIKAGLLTSNWADIALAYKSLTGEIIEPPATANQDHVTLLLSIRNLIDESLNTPHEHPLLTAADQTVETKQNSQSKNRFHDDMTLCLDDTRVTVKRDPVPRRPAYKPVEMTCGNAKCGRKEQIPPDLAKLYQGTDAQWFCNRCVGRK